VLILREVLGFSAKEVAESLDTTVASVNSALQRARAAVDERVPEQSQQATLRELGDDEVRDLVSRYMDAWEREDLDAFTAMLADDATFAMPPLATWYSGRDGIRKWAQAFSMNGMWNWRGIVTSANGQPAIGFYSWNEDEQAYLAFALNVLSFRGREVSDVTAFINRSIESDDPQDYVRFPEQAADPRTLEGTFGRFGLPERLEQPGPNG
jgi:RNA polymerase sigma-70 factor (ECF subfamily)